MGWLRGNTQASVNQSKPKWKEEKVTGKKAEASAEQYIREAVAWEECSLFCFNHYEPDMVDGSCLAAGERKALWVLPLPHAWRKGSQSDTPPSMMPSLRPEVTSAALAEWGGF